MREEEKVMRFLTVLVGSMMTISVFVTFFVVSKLTPSFIVWIAIWFIILWRYPEARWWKKQTNEFESLDWFSITVTGIAILCLEYIAILLMVDFVFPFFQTIFDSMIELFNRTQRPWMP
jgi:hypothetical protein